MDFETFMGRLTDGTQTTIIPFFMTTPRETFIKEVIRRIKRAMKRDEPHRVFLLFQEGISLKKTKSVWDELCARGDKVLDTPESDAISLELVRDMPTEFLYNILASMKTIDYV